MRLEHLLKALVDQADGIVRPILAKVGSNPDQLASDVTERLETMPKVAGEGISAGTQIGPSLTRPHAQSRVAATRTTSPTS